MPCRPVRGAVSSRHNHVGGARGCSIPIGSWNHLLSFSGRIRTVQELLGDRDVSTTMISTHALTRGPAAVRSPADRMFEA